MSDPSWVRVKVRVSVRVRFRIGIRVRVRVRLRVSVRVRIRVSALLAGLDVASVADAWHLLMRATATEPKRDMALLEAILR